MRLKKRKKTSRLRGSTTHGWGARQRHKGHGCKGGVGMSGSGKRGDQKKQKVLMLAGGKYFGKQGLTSRKNAKKRNKQINLKDIQKNFTGNKIDLHGYKILGDGEGFKAEITAKAASKTAIEKMEKANGKIIILTHSPKKSQMKADGKIIIDKKEVKEKK